MSALASSSSIRLALTSSSMKWAVGGWSFFIAENCILSENRQHLISQLGDDGYHAAYGTLSTAAMGSAFYGYFRHVRNAAPLLWTGSVAPLSSKLLGFVFLSVGLGMASQIPPKVQIPVHYAGGDDAPPLHSSTVPVANGSGEGGAGWKVRCPFDFTDKKDTGDGHIVHGLERITRHPGLWSLGFMGLGSACLVPSLPQKAWLAMPMLVALIGGEHTDSRYRRGMGGLLTDEYDRATSNIPFLALLSGTQGNVGAVLHEFVREVKPLNAAIAVGLSGLWVLTKGRGVKIR